MKHVFTALGLALLLAGCGGGGGSTTGNAAGTTTAATGGGGGGGKVKVALISDVGKFNDKSFNQSQLEGLKRAGRELGVEGVPLESKTTSDYTPNLTTAIRQKSDLVISAGFLLANATAAIAKQFPQQQMAIMDYSVEAPPFAGKVKNVRGLTFATNENSYLIGCLAALMAQRQGGKQVISAVGGIKIPTVDIFIAGYGAGAKKCVPGTRILTGYSQDFNAQDKCKTIAENQLSQGSQVVFAVAGQCGLGALQAAKSRGAWGVGVDKDQSFLGSYILTSAVKRVDVAVYDTVKAVRDGTFEGGTDAVFDLRNNGVALGKISPKVPQEFLDRVDALERQIVAGTIKPPSGL
jgi:basic membrane protein A and related proteins